MTAIFSIVDMLNKKYQKQDALRTLRENSRQKGQQACFLEVNKDSALEDLESCEIDQQGSSQKDKVDNVRRASNGDGIVTVSYQIDGELPPIGSNAYYFMISQLLEDRNIDKQMRELKAEQLEGRHLQLPMHRGSLWKQIFSNRPSDARRGSQASTSQRDYKKANMFLVLLGGGKNRGSKVSHHETRTRL